MINVGLKEITSETLGLDSLDVTKLPRTVAATDITTGSGSSAVTGESFASSISGTVIQQGSSYYVKGTTSSGETAYFSAGTPTISSGVVSFTVGTTAISASSTLASLAPLDGIDDALQDIDRLRSDLGAVQNRFEDAITNLRTNETNLAAARSRIEDADYAVEVANMTRAQILQQAGTSVLAQANQIPQNVLSLLG